MNDQEKKEINELKGKNVLVLGGSGAIGSSIVHAFKDLDSKVVIGRLKKSELASEISEFHVNVIEENSVKALAGQLGKQDIIVYAVGYCPKGEFDEHVGTSLYELKSSILSREIDLHVIGLKNIYSHMEFDQLIVIGSRLAFLNPINTPPELNAAAYGVAKGAQAHLIKWMRKDLEIIRKSNSLIHLLSPGAVNSPFHEGAKLQPPKDMIIEISDVTDEVLVASIAGEIVDKVLDPKDYNNSGSSQGKEEEITSSQSASSQEKKNDLTLEESEELEENGEENSGSEKEITNSSEEVINDSSVQEEQEEIVEKKSLSLKTKQEGSPLGGTIWDY